MFVRAHRHVDIEEASLSNLEGHAHPGSRLDSLIEALVCMCIDQNSEAIDTRKEAQNSQDSLHSHDSTTRHN